MPGVEKAQSFLSEAEVARVAAARHLRGERSNMKAGF
jgi:hypothetical protein